MNRVSTGSDVAFIFVQLGLVLVMN